MDINEFKAAIGDPSTKKKFNRPVNDDPGEGEFSKRNNLLEKYGLKDMDEEEIEELLGSYDRDGLNNKELESMERVLSKRLHSIIMSVHAIKKAAVEVFMDYSDELRGIVTVIVEYEHNGFLNRIVGHSNSGINAEIIELTQREINELFKNSPELAGNFEIDVESF